MIVLTSDLLAANRSLGIEHSTMPSLRDRALWTFPLLFAFPSARWYDGNGSPVETFHGLVVKFDRLICTRPRYSARSGLIAAKSYRRTRPKAPCVHACTGLKTLSKHRLSKPGFAAFADVCSVGP